MTPRMAIPRGTPNPTKEEVRTASTTPRPPGVIGMAARTFAKPYETSRASTPTRYQHLLHGRERGRHLRRVRNWPAFQDDRYDPNERSRRCRVGQCEGVD